MNDVSILAFFPKWAVKYEVTCVSFVSGLAYIDTNGEEFYERRELMGKTMMKPAKIANYVPHYSEITDDLLEVLQKELDKSSDSTIDNFISYVDRWQFECGGILSFNQRLGFLDEDYQTANPSA